MFVGALVLVVPLNAVLTGLLSFSGAVEQLQGSLMEMIGLPVHHLNQLIRDIVSLDDLPMPEYRELLQNKLDHLLDAVMTGIGAETL